ncbi:hypothetical protein [Aquimonas sp.]|jgi:hypothetical protein|uniref:hypothetical protein n=1 Tax=Aquimonas sp. TaxID=1872588 RepID=UPI0037BE87F7
MRIIVLGLMAAGSFLMLSADTRAQVGGAGPHWCSTGTVVPVADFTFYPELLANGGLARLAVGSAAPAAAGSWQAKDKGIFDEDYPPYPEEEIEAVEVLAVAAASLHCAQYTIAGDSNSEIGTATAAINDLDAVVRANLVGSYDPSRSLTGTCMRCAAN